MTDPIADMLTRIKNGYLARHQKVEIPHSNVKMALAEVLSRLGYVGKIERKTNGSGFIIHLNYQNGLPALTDVKRMSTPGRRIYVKAKDLVAMRHRLGAIILTTPKGIKTHKEAIKENLGGELVCAVW